MTEKGPFGFLLPVCLLMAMAKRNIKWTQEMRRVLYARLVMEFGAHATWEVRNYPKGKRKRYDVVLEELARYFSTQSGSTFHGSALDQQVAWATTKQESITNAGFAYQFIMNKSAALEMGFLSSAELPDYIVTQTDRPPQA